MNSNAAALLGLSVIVGALSGLLMFATLRLFSAARQRQLSRRAHGRDPEMLSVALEEAIARLKAQERATAARAEASERLSGEIISGLTSGLIVVGLRGEVRILNPAGRRMLDLPDALGPGDMVMRPRGARAPGGAATREQPLLDVIAECL